MTNEAYKECMTKIKQWAAKKHIKFEVINNRTEKFNFETNTVEYNTNISKEKQIFGILHELGHFLVNHNMLTNDRRYTTQLEAIYDKRKAKSHAYRIEVLREEFDAWERGANLAKRLKLPICLDRMKKDATKWILTYCDWIHRRNWKEP